MPTGSYATPLRQLCEKIMYESRTSCYTPVEGYQDG